MIRISQYGHRKGYVNDHHADQSHYPQDWRNYIKQSEIAHDEGCLKSLHLRQKQPEQVADLHPLLLHRI
ncbi:MAG: hypothetical protein WCD79_04720, partial [Chthoniobacteraceae bacterium]